MLCRAAAFPARSGFQLDLAIVGIRLEVGRGQLDQLGPGLGLGVQRQGSPQPLDALLGLHFDGLS